MVKNLGDTLIGELIDLSHSQDYKPNIDLETTPLDVGLDSLETVEYTMRIEVYTGVNLNDTSDITTNPNGNYTLGELKTYIERCQREKINLLEEN